MKPLRSLALILVRLLFIHYASADQTSKVPSLSTIPACSYSTYNGKSVAMNPQQCGAGSKIIVRDAVNLKGFKCNSSEFTKISKMLVESGPITLALNNSFCSGAMFTRIKSIVSFERFAIHFNDVNIREGSFSSLESIVMANLGDQCPLTVSDVIYLNGGTITPLIQDKLHQLAEDAIHLCQYKQYKGQVAPTAKEPEVREEDFLYSDFFITITKGNFIYYLLFFPITFALWPFMFKQAYATYCDMLIMYYHVKNENVWREGNRAGLELGRILMPQANQSLQLALQFMRYFDKTIVMNCILANTILSYLVRSPSMDDAIKAKDLNEKLNEVGTPVLLEIHERNETLHVKGILKNPIRLFTEAERRDLGGREPPPVVIEMGNEGNGEKKDILRRINCEPLHKDLHPPVSEVEQRMIDENPIAYEFVEDFFGPLLEHFETADWAAYCTKVLDEALEGQEQLEDVILAVLNHYRKVEDAARDMDEQNDTEENRRKNRLFQILEFYEDAEGKEVPRPEYNNPAPLSLEEINFKYYDETKTLAENFVHVKSMVKKFAVRMQWDAVDRFNKACYKSTLSTMNHELFSSFTASARIKRHMAEDQKRAEEKEKEQREAANAKREKESATFEAQKKAVIGKLAATGKLKKARKGKKVPKLKLSTKKPAGRLVDGRAEITDAVRVIKKQNEMKKAEEEAEGGAKKIAHTAEAPSRGFFSWFSWKKKVVEPEVSLEDLRAPFDTKNPVYYKDLKPLDGVKRERKRPGPCQKRLPEDEMATKVIKKKATNKGKKKDVAKN